MAARKSEINEYGTQVNYVGKTLTDETPTSGRWWLAEEDDLHRHVQGVVNQIDQGLSSRRLEWLRNARLYSGRDFKGFGLGSFQKSAPIVGQRIGLTINVCKSCVDTAASKIASKKPRAEFVTSGGDYELKERARNLTKYLDGLYDAADVYQISQRVFVDSGVFGTGILKVFADGERIKVERVLIDELLVDEDDGRYGYPTQIHQRKFVSRESVLECFGDTPERIAKIKAAAPVTSGGSNTVSEQLAIVESWKLPSGPGATDGRHCITIENCTLFAETYEEDWFPLVFLRWSPALLGFFGIALVDELLEIQREIGRVLRQISRAIEAAVPRAFVESGSSIDKGSLTDEVWSICNYKGTPPSFSVPSAQNPEVYQYLETLVKRAYEITGISQMAATSQKAPGVDAAVAIRALADIATERFLPVGERFERFHMDIARVMVSLTRKLAKSNKKLSIKVIDGKSSTDLSWVKDVDLEAEQYLMRCFPTGALPPTPAGRLQFVQELASGGFIGSKEQALSLLDFPDLEGFISTQTAGIDNMQRIVGRILNKGIVTAPTKWMFLEYGIPYAQAQLLVGEDQGRPDDRLELLQSWLEEASALADSLKPPMPGAPPGAPPGMAPPGMPPAPPGMAA